MPRVKADFLCFTEQNAAALDVADACLSPDHGADEAFLRPQAVHAGPGRRAIVFTARRCGVDGQISPDPFEWPAR
jgi:hypothetical protein